MESEDEHNKPNYISELLSDIGYYSWLFVFGFIGLPTGIIFAIFADNTYLNFLLIASLASVTLATFVFFIALIVYIKSSRYPNNLKKLYNFFICIAALCCVGIICVAVFILIDFFSKIEAVRQKN